MQNEVTSASEIANLPAQLGELAHADFGVEMHQSVPRTPFEDSESACRLLVLIVGLGLRN